jgi:hypothetical protein
MVGQLEALQAIVPPRLGSCIAITHNLARNVRRQPDVGGGGEFCFLSPTCLPEESGQALSFLQ